MAALARWFLDSGLDTMAVCVLAENPFRRFYEHFGGKLVDEYTIEIGTQFVDEVVGLGLWRWDGNRLVNNLFTDLPTALPEELVEVLAGNQHVRIKRIVSTGHASPKGFWDDQEEAEWGVVLKGEAKLLTEGGDKAITIRAGDHVLIPAHRKHRGDWTTPNEPAVWLAVHYGGAS